MTFLDMKLSTLSDQDGNAPANAAAAAAPDAGSSVTTPRRAELTPEVPGQQLREVTRLAHKTGQTRHSFHRTVLTSDRGKGGAAPGVFARNAQRSRTGQTGQSGLRALHT